MSRTVWGAYWRLMRFDKPIGTALLWFPIGWALALVGPGFSEPGLLLIFFLGTVLMRSAGCVINDIADRNIDRHVLRTQNRPLTSGELRLGQALCCFGVLVTCAASLLFFLPLGCLLWACIAVAITVIYPFCKRFFSAPQLVLGIAFSVGIPMVYVAASQPTNETTVLLFFINALWVIAYDTEYAMVDKKYDLCIGVRSTAILFGDAEVTIIGVLLVLSHSFWIALAQMHSLRWPFWLAWTLALGLILFQIQHIRSREAHKCFQAFLLNAMYGLLLWVGLLTGVARH